MTRQITATELKTKLLSVLDDVEDGEEIEVIRRGRTIARLAPAMGPRSSKGMFAGVARTASEDDDLLSTGEVWEAS